MLILYGIVAYNTVDVESTLENKEYIISNQSIDNDSDANKLIKSLYKDEDLQSFYHIKKRILN